MSESQQAVAVRTYALWTAHVATLLGCTYDDAAVFLLKLGTILPLLQDADFQDKLARYSKAVSAQPLVSETPTPQGKGIH